MNRELPLFFRRKMVLKVPLLLQVAHWELQPLAFISGLGSLKHFFVVILVV